jgi:hypothetical protein
VCACEVKTEPTLSQALHMLNGEIAQGGLIKSQLDAGKPPKW